MDNSMDNSTQSTQSLLPNNKTLLENVASQTLAETYQLNAHELIRSLYDAQTCPAHLLSYLAQAVAVDFWHYDWPEQRKRDVIHQALAIHRLKGTPQALKTAMENQGITASFREWWQTSDPDWWLPSNTTPATGTVVIHALMNDNQSTQVDKPKLEQLRQAVSHAKRESIHISIELGFKWDGTLNMSLTRAPSIASSDHQGLFSPLHPLQGLTNLVVGGSSGRITLADFEFIGATT